MNTPEQALLRGSVTTEIYALLDWEEIALWYLLPYWGISQAWWKASKGVEA